MSTKIQLPVARIVWGHPAVSTKKTDQQNKPVFKDDSVTPVIVWSFGLAIPKEATIRQQYAGRADIEQLVQTMSFEHAVWPHMAAEAQTAYPNVPGNFSWKYKDGDTAVDRNGKLYSEREGYAGHYVLAVSSELMATPLFKLNASNTYDQLPADAIKCGDYVATGVDLKVNVPKNSTHTPGLYINPTAVEFVGYGSEIKSQGAVNPMEVFGGQARLLPPGATAAPSAPAGAPGLPVMPGPAPTPPGMPMAPAPVAPPAPTPPAPPPPAVAGPTRPTDPAYIHAAGTPQEQWHINGAWIAAPQLPPPAPDFVQAATGQTPPAPPVMPGAPTMPGMPLPR